MEERLRERRIARTDDRRQMRQDDGIGLAFATLAVRRPGRLSYAAVAAVGLGIAMLMIGVWDAAWWQTVAFALGPDLAVLYGIAPGLARGQLHPRAVPLYNALHRFWGPLALAAAVLAAGLPLGYVAGALAWAVHVAFDRAIGLRQRSPDGFQPGEKGLSEVLDV
jgi:Domain of unknown function (DUF4260)